MSDSNIKGLNKQEEKDFYKNIVKGKFKRKTGPKAFETKDLTGNEKDQEFITKDKNNNEHCIVKKRVIEDKVVVLYDYWEKK